MVIRRKDGSVYKLSGPNPLLVNYQPFEFVLHNFGSCEILVVKDKTLNIPQLTKIDDQLPLNNENKIEHKPIEEKPPELIKPNLIQIACVSPEKMQKKQDLYGEYHAEPQKPFSCQGLVLGNDDFSLTLWVDKFLANGTTIYPKNQEKRWWTIIACSPQKEGYKAIAKLSTYQPAFLSD